MTGYAPKHRAARPAAPEIPYPPGFVGLHRRYLALEEALLEGRLEEASAPFYPSQEGGSQ